MLRMTRSSQWTVGLLLALAWGSASACQAPPPAVVDINANRYYTDKNNSVIDPVLKAQNVAATKPIDTTGADEELIEAGAEGSEEQED